MNQVLSIYTDGGRCIRPLFKVTNGELVINNYLKSIKDLKWNSLVTNVLEIKRTVY